MLTSSRYLKESTSTLSSHLALARANNFALGVKLVRGAYINSDPRHLIHDTKSDTDRAFNNAARMLATLHVTDPSAPRVGLVLASHNKESTDIVRNLRREQLRQGVPLADVTYAQLMGMADELSLGLTKNEVCSCLSLRGALANSVLRWTKKPAKSSSTSSGAAPRSACCTCSVAQRRTATPSSAAP